MVVGTQVMQAYGQREPQSWSHAMMAWGKVVSSVPSCLHMPLSSPQPHLCICRWNHEDTVARASVSARRDSCIHAAELHLSRDVTNPSCRPTISWSGYPSTKGMAGQAVVDCGNLTGEDADNEADGRKQLTQF